MLVVTGGSESVRLGLGLGDTQVILHGPSPSQYQTVSCPALPRLGSLSLHLTELRAETFSENVRKIGKTQSFIHFFKKTDSCHFQVLLVVLIFLDGLH